MSFRYSVLPISNILYHREANVSFCYSIFTHIHYVILQRGNNIVLSLNFTHIHYDILQRQHVVLLLNFTHTIMLYYREPTMSLGYSILPISNMLYHREATSSFCYSITPIFIMLYHRAATMSFCYSIFPISIILKKGNNQSLNVTQGEGDRIGGIRWFSGGTEGDVSCHQHSIKGGLQKIDWELTSNEW